MIGTTLARRDCVVKNNCAPQPNLSGNGSQERESVSCSCLIMPVQVPFGRMFAHFLSGGVIVRVEKFKRASRFATISWDSIKYT